MSGSWLDLVNDEIKVETDNHKHVETEKPHLFRSFDTEGTEIEVLDLLHALIILFKPMHVLETGTWNAYGTIAMAHAVKENGFGEVISVEKLPEKAAAGMQKLAALGLDKCATIINRPSLEYIRSLDKTGPKFDLAFFDSSRVHRADEFVQLHQKGLLADLVLFHDTSRSRIENHDAKKGVQEAYVRRLDEIEQHYTKGSIEFELSRGLRIMQLRK
jgi:predicted O-methyltransferase YrrM